MTAKKLGLSLIILMVLMLIVSACSLGPTDAECEDAMQQLNISFQPNVNSVEAK